MKSPAGHGWSTEKMKAALDFAKASGSSAIMIVQDGLVVDQFGDIDKKISSYSVRKSLISALYGIYSAEGVIDITIETGAPPIDNRQVFKLKFLT